MNELEDQFDQQTIDLLHSARDEFMAAFTRAAHAGDTQAIKDATLKVQAEYARIIKNALKGAFEYGKNNAAKEIGADAPPNPADILRQIDIQSDAIADSQITEITTDAKNAYVQALNKGQSITAALAAADAAAADAIDTLTSDASAIVVSGYINHGRNTVFDKNADDIYALQRSESSTRRRAATVCQWMAASLRRTTRSDRTPYSTATAGEFGLPFSTMKKTHPFVMFFGTGVLAYFAHAFYNSAFRR